MNDKVLTEAVWQTEGTGLWAAEDFDLFHVEEIADCAEASQIEIVDQEAHGGVGRLPFKL